MMSLVPVLVGLLQANAPGFKSYLQEYGNTICGRHPIAVLLNVSQH